jgi:hypothetical protein
MPIEMTIQLGQPYSINRKQYRCTAVSDFHAEFRSYDHKTKPEIITIKLGILVKTKKQCQ